MQFRCAVRGRLLIGPSGRFDVILCHFGPHGRKAVLLREAGVIEGKIITAMHGDDIYKYPRQFAFPIYKILFEKGDLFLPVSDKGRLEIIRLGCPPGKARVHRMGVDPSLFKLRPEYPDVQILKLLTVARLVPVKGIAEVLEALACVRFPFCYQIIGDGPLRSALEQQAGRLGLAQRIEFLGARTADEILIALNSADLFLLPSHKQADGEMDGIPVALMEAMAAALPVVSTIHSAIPELVESGLSGILVEEGNCTALVAAIESLAENRILRRDLGINARLTILRDFEIQHWNQVLVEIFEEIKNH